ncbi:MAG: hypothetical protein NTV08_20335 [Verrucomicrobia bacterium]|nr:hypothetical protein [Verrucomicrobiota bacterium]
MPFKTVALSVAGIGKSSSDRRVNPARTEAERDPGDEEWTGSGDRAEATRSFRAEFAEPISGSGWGDGISIQKMTAAAGAQRAQARSKWCLAIEY